ncbi:MAG: M28 family peptidase, partial [Acidobacteriota bacterium]
MSHLSVYTAYKRSLTAFLLTTLLCTQLLAQAAAPTPSSASAIESELVEKINVQSIKEMTAALASPEMEGRGTGQPGGDKAANWIADKFKSFGLKPLGDKGSYLQKVEFKETVLSPEGAFSIDGQSLAHGTEFAFLPQNNGNKNVSGDMVFVSYAIQAKQAGIDMLAGASLAGKVAVVIEGPPPGFPEKTWTEQRAQMTVIGGLIRSGAAAIVLIGDGKEKNPPEESISYFSRRQITLPDEQGYPPQIPPFIYVSSKGAEKLFAKSGVTREQAIASGASRDFKPIDLKQKAKIVAKYDVKKVAANNVVGYLEGSEPKLKAEAVVFSAHYDAYGKDNGKTYFGAADNALGTAEMLAVAEAFSKASQKPKRSLVFVAVTGEEYGLYGSKYWAKNPTWDVKKIAANLNLDGIGSEVYGPVKTMVGYGAE